MSELSAKEFVALTLKSNLLNEKQITPALDKLYENVPLGSITSELVGEVLVNEELLTVWQERQLRKGRHKGYFLQRYKILDLLGAGGMGSVYLAEHSLLKRRDAIKVLPRSNISDTSLLDRFLLEARAAAALNHKNIVKVYDIGNEEGVYYLAMEYIQGCDLLDIVKSGHQPIHKIVDYIRQSAVGLGYAHSQNLVHRDVKPANLFADKQGVVKVLDLGLAKFSDAVSSSSELDDEKCVLGTADYIAPEQSYNSVDVDARADIYSLGCTLYFLLTRRVPFPDGSVPDRIRAHRSKEPKPIGELRSETPHEIVRICSKMMAKDVEQRYQTMNEVADDLGDWLEENDYEFEGSGGSSSAQPMPPKTSRPSGGGSAVHIHPRASKAGRSSSRHLHRRGGSSHRMIGGIGSPKSKKKSSSKRPSKKPAKDKIQVSGNDSSKPMVTPIKGTKKKNASHSRAPGRKSPSVSGGMSSARMMQKKSKKLAGKEWAVLGICGGVLLLVAVSLIIWVTSSS